jgi:hypothetical protein
MKLKSNARRYSQGEALRLALTRQKFTSAGATSTLLFEAFIEDSGRLTASKVVSRGLCNSGEFSLWRKQLIDKGWLIWSETQNDKGLYFPGKKLTPYINKEKIAQKEIATRESVEKVRADLSAKIAVKADLTSLDAKADRSELAGKADRFELADKADRSELEATKVELAETRDELAEFRARMLKFERLAQRLAAATGDPITTQKIEEQKRCAEELNQLVN